MALSRLVEEVRTHLLEVLNDPSKSLNDKLLGSFGEHVSESLSEDDRDTLLNKLSELLPLLQQNPAPVTDLICVLVAPERYDFTRVLSVTPPVNFQAGLTSDMPSINLVVLTLLEKAKFRPSDIGIVAGKAEIVGSLIKLWLCTEDSGVARRAHDVLLGLLQADTESEEKLSSSFESLNGGMVTENLMWRRIFRDKDIYGSIFLICSLETAGREGQLSKREKTVAQARLLDMLLDIDSEPTRTSQFPEIERQYGVHRGGLLHFATCHMVDYRDDVLMHVTLIDFLAKYLRSDRSFCLDFLRKQDLHARTMAGYLEADNQDSLELSFLYGPYARYLSFYCCTYPQDMLRTSVPDSVTRRLTRVLQNLSSGHWSQGKTPKHDLHVVASIPRVVLVPQVHARESPLFLIPTKPANADAFKTLATVFHGISDPAHFGAFFRAYSQIDEENAGARALYFLYMEEHPDFWSDIISAADTVALKDVALAAISFIGAVITAQWGPLPNSASESRYRLPTEGELADRCHATQLPQSGVLAILTQRALATVFPYLMKPAQTFSNLVGGGRGDVESAAYQIAVTKHHVLTLLHQKLKETMGQTAEGREMVAAVGRRVAEGPMGGTSEVGGRVGTMEL